jgi:Immunoglobulin domain/Abnormal spindle-like microcephaly-assoc'd, ASPM-SPD-2-Hydin/Immunoglobulin I-set domain
LITKSQVSSLQLQSGDAVAKKSFTTQQTAIAMTGAGVPVVPLIATQPVSQTVAAGQTATFLVVASGQGHLTYQWQKNGTPIDGAKSSTYNTPATTPADSGSQFTVVVNNSKGNVTSDAATLTVTAAAATPSITTQPVNQAVTVGKTATFSVTASGAAPLSYQWRKNGTAISGATSAAYTTPVVATSDSGSLFSVVVSNSAGNATSNDAILTVTPAIVAPSITTQPVSQTVTVGQTAAFSVTASGTAPLSYQWRKNGTAINGATSSAYTTPVATTANAGLQFTVLVSNSAGNSVSNAAALIVTAASAPPTIATQPANQTVTVGQATTFLVAASGTAPLSYQWQKNGAAISGATSSAYTTPVATSADSGSHFAVAVSNSSGTVTSGTAILTVNAAGQLTANPPNLNYGNISVGSSSILPVTLTNTGGTSVSISNMTLSGAGLSIGGVSSGLILAAGNSAVLNVTYAPSASGTLNGSVSIASNANNSTVTISLAGTAVQPVSHSATLNLTPNSSNVTGYNIYRSSMSNGPYTRLNSPLVTSTTYIDSTVVANQTYYYVATSVDSSGNETVYSNQVSATIPTP